MCDSKAGRYCPGYEPARVLKSRLSDSQAEVRRSADGPALDAARRQEMSARLAYIGCKDGQRLMEAEAAGIEGTDPVAAAALRVYAMRALAARREQQQRGGHRPAPSLAANTSSTSTLAADVSSAAAEHAAADPAGPPAGMRRCPVCGQFAGDNHRCEPPRKNPDTVRNEDGTLSFAGVAKEERAEAMRAELVDLVAEIESSDGWQRFLDFQQRGHAYSLNNRLLALRQKPDATMIRSATAWKKDGRFPAKGSKAIWVLAPITRKRTETDTTTGEESTRQVVIGTRAVPVFDVSQTAGDPLPDHPYTPAVGKVPPGMTAHLQAKAAALGWTVREAPDAEFPDGRNGDADFVGKVIRVRASNPELQRAMTLCHELGHVSCEHGAENVDYAAHRGQCEVEAESTAYLVGRQMGVHPEDIKFRSGPYLAGWGGSKATHAAGTKVLAAARSILGDWDQEEESE